MAIADAVLGTQPLHSRVDLLQRINALLGEHIEEAVDNQAAGDGIVRRPVVVKLRQAQCVSHQIQLEFAQLGQQILSKNQCIRGCKGIGVSQLLTGCPDKAGIKVRVVGNQHPVSHKFQKLGQHLVNFRSARQHGIGNSRQFDDPGFQLAPGIHKGLKAVNLLTVLHNDGTDFDDLILLRGQAGGFQIECHISIVKGHIPAAVHHDPVIHIVDIISLAAIQDLDARLGRRFHGIRKGLRHAVIRNGDGPMPPGRCLLNRIGSHGQSVHVAHHRMQMQLYPLSAGGSVLSFGHRTGDNGIGL